MKKVNMLRLVVTRASKYTRFLGLIFFLMLVLVSVVVVFVQVQNQKLDKQFQNNKTMHFIEVESLQRNNEREGLTFQDGEKILSIVREQTMGYVGVSFSWAFPFGMPAHDDEDSNFFIEAFTGDDIDKLAGLSLENAYRGLSTVRQGNVVLDVPVVSVEEGGFSSNDSRAVSVEVDAFESDAPIDFFVSRAPSSSIIRISQPVFDEVLKGAFGISFDEYAQRSNEKNLPIDPINAVYVYVENLEDVEKVGNALQGRSYGVRYALDAFDDGISQINMIIIGSIAVLVVLIVAGTVGVIVNARAYIRLSRRDIGLLAHYGYERKTIASLYSCHILRILLFSSVVPVVLLGVGAFVFLDGWFLPIVDMCVFGVAIFVFYMVILKIFIVPTTRKPVIELMKRDQEFA
ncbi:MAG: hypothetical protein J6M18_00890 [Actinomycetaceae bacterium]|nr:hypothetical protein [Actinomycetaceae bacterium]